MLNFFIKTKPWMLAMLLAATSVYGKNNSQCPPPSPTKPCPKACPPPCPPKPCPKPCPQPCPPTQICPADPCCPEWPTPVLNAAYNYPARIQTRCPWDVFVDASFIYWQPLQENMELGFANSTAAVSQQLTSGVNGDYINMDFNFKPGFKVELGGYFDHDNWDLHFEYTWFHGKQSHTAEAPAIGQIAPLWGTPTSNFYNTASEKWTLKMDILQLDLGRWHYVGTKLIAHPYVGARAVWIRQNVRVNYQNTGSLGIGSVDDATIKGKTRSWALGPEVGVDTNWNLGAGFRFFGNAEGDIVFTKYTKAGYSEVHVATPAITPFSAGQDHIYTLRTHLDLELGFGWGTYVDCNNWYLDFAAGYGFQVFFDQNMFRHYTDSVMDFNSNMPNGNLYVHGLTATFKLDF